MASGGVPKVLDPPLVRQRLRKPVTQESQPSARELAERVEQALKMQRIPLQGFALSADGSTASIEISPLPYRDSLKLVGRTARSIQPLLPDTVNELQVTEISNGLAVYQVQVPSKALRELEAGTLPQADFQSHLTLSSPATDRPALDYLPARYPQLGWSLNPALRSSIGGPDSFYFGQLWLKLGGSVNLTPSWNVDGALGLDLYNNFDDLKLESNSELPRVRSDIKNYLKEGKQALVRLETNYVHHLAPEWYGRVSAGLFEEMYGGIAGEVLYRPTNPRWALGVNINRVRQRDFEQRFSFRDYEVTTGHVTGYFEFTRPSVLVKLSAGQYLAGDRGATLDVSRQFSNGIRIGAFATKTNVSARQFGEGEFDKGIYFILPLDAMLPRSTTGSGAFVLRPLTRDGGQMVRDGRSLYDITYGAVKVRLPASENLFFQ